MKNTTASVLTGVHPLSAEALLPWELRSRVERGCDVQSFEERWRELQSRRPPAESRGERAAMASWRMWEDSVEALYREVSNAPGDAPDMARAEPSAFQGIKNTAPRRIEPAPPAEGDKAWVGRARAALLATLRRELETGSPEVVGESVPWLLSVELVEEQGIGLLPDHVGRCWLRRIPPALLTTDNFIPYANALNGHSYPVTSTRRHPLREQDGAMARGILYGLMSPGNPRRAARLAFHDAAFSHTRNGIFAAMALAAGIAAGLRGGGRTVMLEAALDVIPMHSRLAAAIAGQLLGWPAALPYEWSLEALNPRHAIVSFLEIAGDGSGMPASPVDGGRPLARRLAHGAWEAVALGLTAEPGDHEPVEGLLERVVGLARLLVNA